MLNGSSGQKWLPITNFMGLNQTFQSQVLPEQLATTKELLWLFMFP